MQAAVDGAGGAARVPAEGVQGQQASVHGERGAAVEAQQRRRGGQPPQGAVGQPLPLLQQPAVASQLGPVLQPTGVPEIATGSPNPSPPPLPFQPADL